MLEENDKIFCYRCGKENLASAAFCQNCGTHLRAPPQTNLPVGTYSPVPINQTAYPVLVAPPPVTNLHYGVPDVYTWRDSPKKLILTILTIFLLMPVLTLIFFAFLPSGYDGIAAVALIAIFLLAMVLIWSDKI